MAQEHRQRVPALTDGGSRRWADDWQCSITYLPSESLKTLKGHLLLHLGLSGKLGGKGTCLLLVTHLPCSACIFF